MTDKVKATIEIPDDLLRRAESEAALRGTPLDEVIVAGIVQLLGHPERVQVRHAAAGGRFADGCGIVDSGIGDLSSNPKHLETFGRERRHE